MTYTIRLTKQADKDLVRLDKVAIGKAVQALTQLKSDPLTGHTLSGRLKGVRSLEFSAPGGVYRAAYVVKAQECVVFLVGPHENFYTLAQRRYETLKKLDKRNSV